MSIYYCGITGHTVYLIYNLKFKIFNSDYNDN